jgi:hypothetical protein
MSFTYLTHYDLPHEVGRVDLAQALLLARKFGVVGASIVTVSQCVDHEVDVTRLGLCSLETSEWCT